MQKNPQKVTPFSQQLAQYKQAIDADIEEYAKQVQRTTLQNYGANSSIATDAYFDVLKRGGKRIRGALAIVGYEMSGGKNRDMALQVARALEMIHAYVLILDDIIDRSSIRRDGPSAHVALAEYYSTKGYGNDERHFGESIAATTALIGNHAAQMIMANLDAPDDLKINAISVLNRGMIVTVHGQFNDIFNEVVDKVSEQDVMNVTEWKTAHYTFLNPLHIGMILAGADCHATDAITDYALNMGRAFQLVDDNIGTFSNQFDVGKSPMDDIREGKRTLLSIYALQHASAADKNFLVQMLGNPALTKTEFERVKEIFIQTGAREYTQQKAEQFIVQAKQSLKKESSRWSDEGTQFLDDLADYLLLRKT